MVRAMRFAKDAGGWQQIEKHILSLSEEVKDTILSQAPHCLISPYSDAALSSGLTVFFPFRWDNPREVFTDSKTAGWVVSELLKKNIQVRFIGFEDADAATGMSSQSYAIRVSTAYFNTAGQVETFRNALQEVLMRVSYAYHAA